MASATAATCGKRKASSAMVRRPMRRVDVKQKEIAVVTTRATAIENISYAFGNWQRIADGVDGTGRYDFGKWLPLGNC
jgi:hypothetical protein